MSVQTAHAPVRRDQVGAVADDVIDRLLTPDSTIAAGELMTASEGDPVLLRALVLTALDFDALTRAHSLDEVLEGRRSTLTDKQLVALRGLTAGWARAHELVATELDHRSAAEVVARPSLTHRQRQVLELLSEGLTVRAIAHRLFLSPRTVGKHLEHLYRRLGTSDRLTAVIRAQRQGLLTARPALVGGRARGSCRLPGDGVGRRQPTHAVPEALAQVAESQKDLAGVVEDE